MSIESFFQQADWSPRFGARLKDFGSALQGREGGNLDAYNQNAEREARKGNIAGLMDQMGIGGNRRALLDMLPQEAQLTSLYGMQDATEAQRRQAAATANFNAMFGQSQNGGQATAYQAPISQSIPPPAGFPQSIVDAATGQDSVSRYNAGLSRTESGGNYSIVNAEGYGGKYQWGQDKLTDYNRATGQNITMEQFLASPQIQEDAQRWNVSDVDGFIKGNGLDQYIGQNIGGVQITQNGLRAMAHLGGNNGMKRFLESGGQYNPADSNGTSLADYAQTHAGSGQPATMSAANRQIDPGLMQLFNLANDENLTEGQRQYAQMMLDQAMPADETGTMQEYSKYVSQAQATGQQPMSLLEYQMALRGAGAASQTVNMGGSEIGTIPPGYEVFVDPATGNRSMRQMPGGPASIDSIANARTSGAELGKAEAIFRPQ